MKTYYALLAIERTASPEDVKRAFRREIARYHPDKVQHLGQEFQEIAATRAAELTEAYRILMDGELRQSYDASLDDDGAPTPPRHEPPTPGHRAAPKTAEQRQAPDEPTAEGSRDKRFQHERATTLEVLRRAALLKFAKAVEAIGGEAVQQPPFDAAYRIKPRRGLFSKAEATVTLLMRVVPMVDAGAVEEAWGPAIRGAATSESACLLLLGNGLSPAKDLSAAISEQRRKARKAGPVVIPIDMRDWEALFPQDTPAVVRTLLEGLRGGR